MDNQFDRPTFNADITSKMDDIRETYLSNDDTDDTVFCYAIADIFEDDVINDEGAFHYTDGSNDRSIDFYVRRDNAFTIYQCKSCDLENHPNGKTFQAGCVNELEEAIQFLTSEERLDASSDVERLRNDFQLNKDEHTLTAVLAIEGHLSEPARQRFEQIKSQYAAGNITVRLIDETTLYDYWHARDDTGDPSDIVLKLTVRDADSALWQRGWCCAVLDLKPLLEGLDKYKSRLFDLNVRASLKGSNVNSAIRETISTAKGQKAFIHLNNGIVITCTSYKKSSDGTAITLQGAQVVNGCQTLSTIWDYYLSCNEDAKRELCDNVKILAKVINGETYSKDDLLDQIIVASNHQNPMNERNLKSNSPEQRNIQRSFYSDPLKKELRYFYIRKDGEFEAFIDTHKRIPRLADFKIEGSARKRTNQYRHVDNETIAKIWWAWIGNGQQANTGGVKYFAKPTYQRVFCQAPSLEFWRAMESPDFEFRSDLLEDQSPTQYQYLLALAISTFLSNKMKPEGGTSRLKRETINALIEKGKLKVNSSQEEIATALSGDPKYLHAVWKSQMTLAATEVASFILCKQYGPLDSEKCRKLISLPDVSFWLAKGLDSKFIDDSSMTTGGNLLLNPLYEFIDIAIENFFAPNKQLILVESRPKLWLSKKENIQAVKETCISIDETYLTIPRTYKKIDESFFDALATV